MKNIFCTMIGLLGGIVATLFGGWSDGLLVLVILMGMDYVSGLVVAGVFHASPKSPGGGLESRAGLKGLIRKVATLAVVALAHLIDRLMAVAYVMDAAIIAFCVNEAISILENAGLMGVPIPAVLRKAIDVLRDKSDGAAKAAGTDAAGETAATQEGENLAGGVTSVTKYASRCGEAVEQVEVADPPDGTRAMPAASLGLAGAVGIDRKRDLILCANGEEIPPEELYGIDQGEDA